MFNACRYGGLAPERSKVSLVDVVHDDGGNGHDLS